MVQLSTTTDYRFSCLPPPVNNRDWIHCYVESGEVWQFGQPGITQNLLKLPSNFGVHTLAVSATYNLPPYILVLTQKYDHNLTF